MRIPSLVIVIFFLASSCAANQNQSQMEVVNSMKETIRGDYYYVIPEEKRKAFLVNITKINLGDSPKEVKEILGEPTYDEVVMRKENNKFIVRYLRYYFIKKDEELVNEKTDRLITLWFSEENMLQEITTNAKEVIELNILIVKPM